MKTQKSNTRLLGRLFVFLGAILIVAMCIPVIVAIFLFGIFYGILIGGSVGSWLCIQGISLVVRGRKMFAEDAQLVLQHDTRSPILYLRSFDEDGKALNLKRNKQKFYLWEPRTFEEQLAMSLHNIGPLIAIGKPHEELPELGAARLYVDDPNWKEKVRELITKAQIVLMHLGESDGLMWEFRQVVNMIKPQQLLICLPILTEQETESREIKYKKFKSKTQGIFRHSLPENIRDAQFLYFDKDWEPCLFKPYRSLLLPQQIDPSDEGRIQWVVLEKLSSEFYAIPASNKGMRAIISLASLIIGFLLLFLFFRFILPWIQQ